jgi:hypothetical protein
MPVIPVFRRLKQKNHEASLGYIMQGHFSEKELGSSIMYIFDKKI